MSDELLVAIGGIALFVIVFFCAQGTSSYSCRRLGEETQVASKYTMATGCLVKINDQWIPSDQWRTVK